MPGDFSPIRLFRQARIGGATTDYDTAIWRRNRVLSVWTSEDNYLDRVATLGDPAFRHCLQSGETVHDELRDMAADEVVNDTVLDGDPVDEDVLG